MYSNEAERTNWDIYHVYDDFKLVFHGLYTKNVSVVRVKVLQDAKRASWPPLFQWSRKLLDPAIELWSWMDKTWLRIASGFIPAPI